LVASLNIFYFFGAEPRRAIFGASKVGYLLNQRPCVRAEHAQ